MKHPRSNIQHTEKLQISSSNVLAIDNDSRVSRTSSPTGSWSLGLLWILDVGCWCFSLPTSTATRFSLSILLLFGLLGNACSKKAGEPAASEKEQKEESRVKHNAKGETVITLDSATQQLIGLQTTSLQAIEVRPEIKSYGSVLQAATLATQVVDVSSAQAASQASEAELQRLKSLAVQNNASQRALQSAEATAARDRAQLESARLRLSGSLGGSLSDRSDLPQLMQSLVSLSNALVQLNLAAGETLPGTPIAARILTLSSNTAPIEGSFVGLAPAVDPQLQGRGLLFLVNSNSAGLVPGAAVTGYILIPGEPREGVNLPRTAIVRYKGAVWVYRQQKQDTFERIEVALVEPLQDGWFVRDALKPNDKVVTAGAQMSLSEELKSAAGE